jgi:D-alanyl-D-alanine carboxypeptidase (penicillin-binding protein 5/6)
MKSRIFLVLTCLLAPAIAFPKAMDSIESMASIYVLGDLSSGLVIAEKNASKNIKSASLTKLMALYLIFDALEDGTLNIRDEVKISKTAAMAKGVRMFLNEGDIVTIEDLLKGLVVYGANDAALALIGEIWRTEAQCIVAMTQKAKVLGLSKSSFTHNIFEPTNPQSTSASDLYQLAAAIILDHPSYYHLFKLNEYEWQGITQYNANSLLSRDAHNDGLVVSSIPSLGTIGIISSARNERRILLVIGDESTDAIFASKAQNLINQAFKKFMTIHLLQPWVAITQLAVAHGFYESLEIGSQEKVSVTIPRRSERELEVTIESIEPLIAPIKSGDVVGKLSVKLEEDTILTSDIVALKGVGRAGIMVRGWKRLKSWILQILEFEENN